MEIVERIYELIKSNNTNANRVTKGCGLNSNIFTFWKSGRQKPSLDALIKIAKYFNVSLDYLTGRTANENNNTSYNGANSTLLDSISKLDKLQQIQVQAYINGLQGVKTHNTQIDTRLLAAEAVAAGQPSGKQNNKNNQSKLA